LKKEEKKDYWHLRCAATAYSLHDTVDTYWQWSGKIEDIGLYKNNCSTTENDRRQSESSSTSSCSLDAYTAGCVTVTVFCWRRWCLGWLRFIIKIFLAAHREIDPSLSPSRSCYWLWLNGLDKISWLSHGIFIQWHFSFQLLDGPSQAVRRCSAAGPYNDSSVDRGLLVTDDLPASLSMTSIVKWSGSNLRGAALMTSVRIEWRKFVTVDHETIKLCKGHCMICMSLDHDMSLDHMTVSTSVISQQWQF